MASMADSIAGVIYWPCGPIPVTSNIEAGQIARLMRNGAVYI